MGFCCIIPLIRMEGVRDPQHFCIKADPYHSQFFSNKHLMIKLYIHFNVYFSVSKESSVVFCMKVLRYFMLILFCVSNCFVFSQGSRQLTNEGYMDILALWSNVHLAPHPQRNIKNIKRSLSGANSQASKSNWKGDKKSSCYWLNLFLCEISFACSHFRWHCFSVDP